MSQKRQQEERGGGGGGAGEPGGSSSVMTSSSSLPYRPGPSKRSRVPLRDVIMEVMRNTSIEKFFLAIEPLIRRVVKEEIESAFANHASMMSSVTDALPCKSKNLQLQFMTKLSLPIFTGSKIEGEGSLSITIALVDTLTRQVVASGKESQMKVEIVVLDGNFEGGEDDDWTTQEFNNNIVKEREGKRPLISGDVFVALIDGVGTVGELSFTDNSSWTRSRKFRLGARTEDGCFNGVRVQEAKTESFMVKDHRGELYKKHYPPLLEDEVWRLKKIGKDGAFHKRLNMESIRTVKDFLTLLHLDGPRLRKILGGGMSTKMWEATVDHAETCVLTEQVHLYYPDGVNKAGVVFNVVGEVRGSISDKFVVIDDLTEKEKSEARAAVKQAYEQWKNVFTCDNELLVENHLQLFNMGSPSLHEDQYNQFPMQVSTDGLGLSHSTLQSPDIFSMGPSSSLDPCVLETEESNENRCQLETPQLGGHEVPQESETLDKFSLVCEDCSHSPFSDIYCNPVDPSISFDTQDLGAPLKGFTATIWKPKAAYRGWRTLSHVLGWIFYTKRIVARRKKLMPPPDNYPQIIAATALDIQGLHKTSKLQVSMVKKANVTKTRMAGALDNISYSFLDDTDLGGGCQDKGDTLPSALEVHATVVANVVMPAPEPQAVAQMELGGVSETFSFLNESEGRLAVDDEALKEKVNELEKEIGESQQPLEEKLTTTVQSTIEGIEKDDDKASGARDDPSCSTFPPMQGDFSPKEFEEKMKGLSSEVLSQVSTGWAYRTLILDTILRDRLKEQLESSRKVSGQMADLEGENKKLAQIIKGLEAQQNADKQAVEALRADKTDLLSKFAALTKDTQDLTQKVKFLELEKQSLSTKVATLTAAMSNQETALEGLQKAAEDGDARIEDLEQQLRTCQAELAEKDKIVSDLRAELQKQVTLSLNQNKLIKGSGLAVWKTYDEALRQFGAEPFPLPDDGRIEDFFDWIGQELASLPDIISKVGDYAASLSCESLLKILDGLKCEHINVLGTRAFQFPKDAGVKDCSPTIECIRNRFLLELWIASGREAARMAAAERLAKSKLEEDGDGCTLAQPQSES